MGDQNKCITAGLHFAAGDCLLGHTLESFQRSYEKKTDCTRRKEKASKCSILKSGGQR